MRRHTSILRAVFRVLFPPYLFRILSLCLAIAAPACAPDEPKGPGPNEGTLSIDLVVPGGDGNLTMVNYQVLQNGAPLVPAKQDQILLGAATSATKPNVSIFLPTGSGYSITMTATTSSSISCAGTSSAFAVTAGGTTAVSLNLVCGGGGPMPGGGVVNVTATTGSGDRCPVLTYYSVNPTSLKVGDQSLLGATVADPDTGDTVTYAWSATNGAVTTPTSQNATFTCSATGTATITLSYADVTTLLSPCAAQTIQTTVTCM